MTDFANYDPERCDCGKGDYCPLWENGKGVSRSAKAARDLRVAVQAAAQKALGALGVSDPWLLDMEEMSLEAESLPRTGHTGLVYLPEEPRGTWQAVVLIDIPGLGYDDPPETHEEVIGTFPSATEAIFAVETWDRLQAEEDDRLRAQEDAFFLAGAGTDESFLDL